MSEIQSTIRLPSVRHCAITLGGLALWMSYAILELKAGLHGILLIAVVWVVANCLVLGARPADIQMAMREGMNRAMPAMFIFLMIGVVIAAFILSGTVGTLIYYGLKFIHPAIFLPAGLILCSFMSLAVGTSWGTVATGGIVLMGIGAAMGMPLPLVAGMVVSGASFGDKMSPVSDTTNLAAVSADVELYAHIRSMAYTTIPAYVITLVVFSWFGYQFSDQPLPEVELQALLNGLDSAFDINALMLLPLLVLLILSMRGVLAEAGMLISSLVAAVLAVLFQGVDVATMLTSFYDGASIDAGNERLDKLLNRGGIKEMAWTFTLSFIAISVGAVLDKMGFLSVLMAWVLQMVRRTASLITTATFGTFLSNCMLGESYVSMILSGQMFKEKFDEVGVDKRVLSRSLEEGGTLMTALIPWTTTGVFYSATLGVSTFEYAQWSLLNWINPLIGILFAWIGIAIFKARAQSNDVEKAHS